MCGLNKIVHKHDFSGTGLEPEELDRKRSFDCGNFSEAALDCKKKSIFFHWQSIFWLLIWKKKKSHISAYTSLIPLLTSWPHVLVPHNTDSRSERQERNIGGRSGGNRHIIKFGAVILKRRKLKKKKETWFKVPSFVSSFIMNNSVHVNVEISDHFEFNSENRTYLMHHG